MLVEILERGEGVLDVVAGDDPQALRPHLGPLILVGEDFRRRPTIFFLHL